MAKKKQEHSILTLSLFIEAERKWYSARDTPTEADLAQIRTAMRSELSAVFRRFRWDLSWDDIIITEERVRIE